MPKLFLGIDVGSVSTNLVLLDEDRNVIDKIYLRTSGRPLQTVQEGLKRMKEAAGGSEVSGVATTGSARRLAYWWAPTRSKNEITTTPWPPLLPARRVDRLKSRQTRRSSSGTGSPSISR